MKLPLKFTFKRGLTFQAGLRFRGEGGENVNLQGYVPSSSMNLPQIGTVQLPLSEDLSSLPRGVVTFMVPAAETRSWALGTYLWDIRFEGADGIVEGLPQDTNFEITVIRGPE